MTDADRSPEVQRHGFRTQPRHVAAGVAAVLLLAFVLANGDETTVSFLFWEASVPMWFGLVVAALLGALVGFLLGGRRQRRRQRPR